MTGDLVLFAAGLLVGAMIVGVVWWRQCSGVALDEDQREASGSGAWLPDPVRHGRRLPKLEITYVEPAIEQFGATLDAELFINGLDAAVADRSWVGDRSVGLGVASTFIESLASHPLVLEAASSSGGLRLVRVPQGAELMRRGGKEVAQLLGTGGRAGPRLLVLGGSSTLMVAGLAVLPEVATAMFAEYLLMSAIDSVRRATSMIHLRQVADPQARCEHVDALISQVLDLQESPERWPEVLLRPLALGHEQLIDDAYASRILREATLAGAVCAEGQAEPGGTRAVESGKSSGSNKSKKPGVGTPAQGDLELRAGYRVMTTAVKASALRVCHAWACGDAVAATMLGENLRTQVSLLAEHHRAIAQIGDRRSRRTVGRKWSAVLDAVVTDYSVLGEWIDSSHVTLELGPGAPQVCMPNPAVLADPAPAESEQEAPRAPVVSAKPPPDAD